MNNNQYSFYAVVGTNGVAVMDSPERAERLTKYIKAPHIQVFSQFELAEFWALAAFRQRSIYGDALYYLHLNHAIFDKDIASGKIYRRRRHD